jgi:hypothetical protein
MVQAENAQQQQQQQQPAGILLLLLQLLSSSGNLQAAYSRRADTATIAPATSMAMLLSAGTALLAALV